MKIPHIMNFRMENVKPEEKKEIKVDIHPEEYYDDL